jgi:hypothetical protein
MHNSLNIYVRVTWFQQKFSTLPLTVAIFDSMWHNYCVSGTFKVKTLSDSHRMIRWLINVEQLAEFQLAGETEILGGNRPTCHFAHFVHHKSHMAWPEMERQPPPGEPATNRLSCGIVRAHLITCYSWRGGGVLPEWLSVCCDSRRLLPFTLLPLLLSLGVVWWWSSNWIIFTSFYFGTLGRQGLSWCKSFRLLKYPPVWRALHCVPHSAAWIQLTFPSPLSLTST